MKKNINFFKNKSILITGATGSFGSSFLRHLIKHYRGFRKIIVFSRDELKQHNLSIEFPETKSTYLRYFLGDIRDKIKVAKIRGVQSHGMLCSEYELGMSKEHEGIIDLPKKTKINVPFFDTNKF